MPESGTFGSVRGVPGNEHSYRDNGATARLLGHRQTKGAATDKPDLSPPRHTPTLPFSDIHGPELVAAKESLGLHWSRARLRRSSRSAARTMSRTRLGSRAQLMWPGRPWMRSAGPCLQRVLGALAQVGDAGRQRAMPVA